MILSIIGLILGVIGIVVLLSVLTTIIIIISEALKGQDAFSKIIKVVGMAIVIIIVSMLFQ